jgi:hypothetical protein
VSEICERAAVWRWNLRSSTAHTGEFAKVPSLTWNVDEPPAGDGGEEKTDDDDATRRRRGGDEEATRARSSAMLG